MGQTRSGRLNLIGTCRNHVLRLPLLTSFSWQIAVLQARRYWWERTCLMDRKEVKHGFPPCAFFLGTIEDHEWGVYKLSTINVERLYGRWDEATLPLITILHSIQSIKAETSNRDLLTRGKIRINQRLNSRRWRGTGQAGLHRRVSIFLCEN